MEDYRGKKVLSSYAPLVLKDLKWVIVAEVDSAEALQPAHAIQRLTAGLAAAVGVLAFMLSLFAAGRIVRPVRNLTDWSRRIAAGEIELVEVKAPDNEIGLLNNSFREAVKSLKKSRGPPETGRLAENRTGRAGRSDARGGRAWKSCAARWSPSLPSAVGAQVGVFFLSDGQGAFRLKASYAYQTRKRLANEFQIGEGIVEAGGTGKAVHFDDPCAGGLHPYFLRPGGKAAPETFWWCRWFSTMRLSGSSNWDLFCPIPADQRTFLEDAAERIAIALHSAFAREQLQEALATTQHQAEELQEQQEELKTANEELQEQAQALRESEERLKSQQEELQVTNEELEEKTDLLERQKREIEQANQELERTGAELEEKAEDLALASKYKSDFLANMSHELRTPLNSLLLLSETLSEDNSGNLTEDQKQSLRVIGDSGHQLLGLINEILDLSKIEAGRMELHPQKVAVGDLGDRAERQFRHMAEAKGLALNVTVDASAPVEIEADGGRVEQILRNLLNNAIKFTEKGGISISFTRPEESVNLKKSGLDPSRTLAVAVKDTGIGIPPDKQKVIFEAFQQAEGGTARRYGGTGLGLSISRELAKLLGGEIQLQSEPGAGSTFTLYLPEVFRERKTGQGASNAPFSGKVSAAGTLPPADETRREAAARMPEFLPDDRTAIAAGDKVILIVEDDIHFAPLLQKECRRRGFQTIVAGTGEEGMRLALEYSPAAIILDIRLPGMDGWEVLRNLKENPDLRHIPVHFMSVEEPTIDAFSKGAVGYLKKPVNRQDLDRAFLRLEDIVDRKIKNLLVVEDDEQLRKGIVRLIGNGDVQAEEAASGGAALDAIRSRRYDCVILDLGLPDMSGFEMLKKLQGEEPENIPPVIVYTGRALSPEEERELMEYAESIIIKGVRSEERLLDEASLFLHRMVGNMPAKKRKIITDLHDTDVLFRGKRILVADDDMRNVFALSKILEEKGMEVLKAEDGRRALEVLEEQPAADLVLMDIMMPVMDGYETIRRIRAQERFRHLPIIALTAKAMAKDRDQCIAAGASDYLAKPVDVQRLLSMMRVWLYR